MASGGKKKSKGKTLSLNEFLQKEDGSVPKLVTGSWADEVPDENIISNEDLDSAYSGPVFDRSVLPSAPKAARGPNIDLSRVPTEPPFTAYLGNVPYDASEEDIAQFFRNLKIVTVRIPQTDGRQKGYAYTEFETKQDLLDALSMDDSKMKNRNIKVNLATESDMKSERKRGPDERDDRTEGDWRSGKGGGGGSSFDGADRDRFSGRRGGDRPQYGRDDFERRSDADGGRRPYEPPRSDYRDSDRGGYSRDRGYGRRDDAGGRPDSGYGRRDDGGYRRRDDAGFGRSDDGYGRRDGGGRRDDGAGWRDETGRREDFGSRGGRQDMDGRRDFNREPRGGYSRETHRDSEREFTRARGSEEPPRGRNQAAGLDSSERGSDKGSQDGDHSHDAPKERPKLKLQPRSKPIETEAAPVVGSSSIFGGAKPVDTAAREREIEDRIQHNREKLHEQTSKEAAKPPFGRRDSHEDAAPRVSRERLTSTGSAKGGKTVAPPPSLRKKESVSSDVDSNEGNANVNASSSSSISSAKPEKDETKKLVPAPPPSVNVWEKRKAEKEKEGEDGAHGEAGAHGEGAAKVSENTAPGGPPISTTDVSPPQRVTVSVKDSERSRTEGSAVYKRGGFANRSSERGGSLASSTRGSARGGRGTGTPQSAGRGGKRAEKPIPKSIDEMPKYEEKKAVNFADGNKFMSLLGNEGEEED